ncbi:MAG: thioredoxin domain-containing protein [Deltaproteobacteria bacterium]|nr:thioredoxin domain-containing protein [Deltaproteobacteria bacterium]
MLEKYSKKVKLVFKNFPLSSIHPFAHKAAVAALAAHAQGKFSAFHHKLFENYRVLNDAKIQEIATALKLDMDKFNKAMEDPSIQKLIARDLKEGDEAGIEGIPIIFVNGKLLTSLQGFENLIESELKKGKKK